ncbi:MAG TPA: TIGR02266 family protein, partial [Polyangiaceae bacterium]
SSEHNFYAGFAENISSGGLFIATHVLKPVGEKLEISVNLPDRAEAIRCMGEVRWVRDYSERSNVPPGLGIRFIGLPAPDAEAIERFLKDREPLFYDED